MKTHILLIGFFSLLCVSCTKDPIEPEPDPENPDDKQTLEVTIGEAGGKLETEDFWLVVPAGALDAPVNLTLDLVENDSAIPSNQVTETYRLSGLDRPWSKPMELAIRYDGTLQGENYIALGFNYFDAEHSDTVRAYELFEARDSMDFMLCTLPPLGGDDLSKKAVGDGEPDYLVKFIMTYAMICGWSKIGTVASEFAEINYDMGLNRSKVEKLAGYIDEAVQYFGKENLLSPDLIRGRGKIRIGILEDLSKGKYTYFVEPEDIKPVVIIPGEGVTRVDEKLKAFSMQVSENYFQEIDDKQLRMISGAGVFRFENYCYFKQARNWLIWAYQDWVAETFYGSNTRTPEQIRVMHPFHGMNTHKMEDYYAKIFPLLIYYRLKIFHGEGMAPFVKYLMENHNENHTLMKDLYAHMLGSGSLNQPIDALLGCMDVPEYSWWPDFFKSYLQGESVYISLGICVTGGRQTEI